MTTPWITGTIRESPGRPPTTARVVKIGGSLLARTAWPGELRDLLAGIAAPATVIVGGGAVVDGLRAIDAAGPRPPALLHRLAIDAMALTARIVADAIAAPLVAEPVRASGVIVLDVPAWLAREGRSSLLPEGWHVTSDSIAALAAATSDASLVLAKSVPPPSVADLKALAEAGWVDRHFPVVAARVPAIHWAAPAESAG